MDLIDRAVYFTIFEMCEFSISKVSQALLPFYMKYKCNSNLCVL